MVKYHDPQAEVRIETVAYRLGIKLKGSNKSTVGLLANGFPDSENFLAHIASVIQDQEPGIKLERYNKGNASIPASDEILHEITQKCDAVITAYGH